MKDELGRKIMKEFVVMRPKMCSYLIDDGYVDKRLRALRKVWKR